MFTFVEITPFINISVDSLEQCGSRFYRSVIAKNFSLKAKRAKSLSVSPSIIPDGLGNDTDMNLQDQWFRIKGLPKAILNRRRVMDTGIENLALNK